MTLEVKTYNISVHALIKHNEITNLLVTKYTIVNSRELKRTKLYRTCLDTKTVESVRLLVCC